MVDMKTISGIHTGYIALISTMILIVSSLSIVGGMGFNPLVFLVALFGICILPVYFYKRSRVEIFQLLWWLPQLIQVFIYEKTAMGVITYPIFTVLLGIHLAIGLGWEMGDEKMLWISMNLVALIGITLALIRLADKKAQSGSRTSNKQVTNEGVHDGN